MIARGPAAEGSRAWRKPGRSGSPERSFANCDRLGRCTYTRPMSSEFILETRDLTKEFKGFVAVNKVNLRVKRGSIHALIGPNGAGKTTCFNLLTKFLIPTDGTIRYKDRDITGLTAAEVARLGMVRSF